MSTNTALLMKVLKYAAIAIAILTIAYRLTSTEASLEFLAYALPCLAAAIGGGGIYDKSNEEFYFWWSLVAISAGFLCYSLYKLPFSPVPAVLVIVFLMVTFWLVLRRTYLATSNHKISPPHVPAFVHILTGIVTVVCGTGLYLVVGYLKTLCHA
jgi:hypothetical protein